MHPNYYSSIYIVARITNNVILRIVIKAPHNFTTESFNYTITNVVIEKRYRVRLHD